MMRREDVERLVLEEHTSSADEEVRADAERRLQEQEDDERALQGVRERQGR